jgi:CP family cyanate transporter-like MFS transporter
MLQDIDVRMFLHSRLAWQVTLVFGLQSMNAYASRTWLPAMMQTKDFSMSSAGTTVALAGLLGGALAMAVPHLAQRSSDQRPALWAISVLTGVAYLGVLYGSHTWVVIWVVAASIGQWCSYPLALLLIIMRSENALHAQSLSAMAQMFGYLMGASAPLLTGALFDATGVWHAALWFMAAVALGQALAGHAAGRLGHVRRRGGELLAETGAP